jgi:hypothetical protein
MGSFVTGMEDLGPAEALSYATPQSIVDALYDLRAAIVDLESGASAVGVNVKDHLAAGDGVTDDTAAFVSAFTALPATGGVLIIPPGTYILNGTGMVLRCPSNTVIRGSGAHNTILKSGPTLSGWLLQSSVSFPAQNVAVEDVGFHSTVGTGVGAIYGAHIQGLAFRRCRFLLDGSKYGLVLSGAVDYEIRECHFHGQAKRSNIGVQLSAGAYNFSALGCRFDWLGSGIIVDCDDGRVGQHANNVHVADCYFDQGWWLLPALKSGSAGVTYTASTEGGRAMVILTEPGADFTALGLSQFDAIRVMTERRTAALTSATNTVLTDSSATFVTSGVLRGEIIRCGTKHTVVDEVESETRIRIEGWRDANYLLTTPPAAGTTYTAYRTLIGKVYSWTATTINTYDGFSDTNGVPQATPAANTLYEWGGRPIYNLHVEYGAKNIRVLRNMFRRGWGDQCSIYCNRAQILGNTIEDGQDMGITLNGTTGDGRSIVSDNRIDRQGSSGIYIGSCINAVVSNNVVSNTSLSNHVNLYTVGGIQLYGAKDILISNNVLDGGGLDTARAGIGLQADSTDPAESANDGITIQGNQCIGFAHAGITIRGNRNTNIRLRDNRASLSLAANSEMPGGDFGTLRHGDLGVVGTPEGAVKAGPGTLFIASTGVLYVKETGTGNTGWVGK